MPRRYSPLNLLAEFAKIEAQNKKRLEKEAQERQRNLERAQREELRQKAQANKEAKEIYYESRLEETENHNKELIDKLSELNSLLDQALQANSKISFDIIRKKDKFQDSTFTPELSSPLYDKEKLDDELKVQEHNREVDEFENAYRNGDPTAVVSYFNMVLEHSNYPNDFPQEFRIAYVPEPKELVIEYELPLLDVIPTVAEYRYIKSKDIIDKKPRKALEIKDQYQDIVASVCLRTIHEVIEADQNDHIQVVVINGFIQAVEPSTGRDIRPCIISIRVTKNRFGEINLSRIDKRACLRYLGAQISSSPDEMLAVKPIVEFDMVDKRFVEQSDILSDLENRPNIMDLNPFEFENLVSNLFGSIGFQTKQTRSTRDSGVDTVAFDPRPILGGKVVIQAKRYKNVVGVAAVRDLYGTMINEGASKGILVTTSHYGPDAFDFAINKPIELIDGSGLLYLLEQQGIKAKIIMPEE